MPRIPSGDTRLNPGERIQQLADEGTFQQTGPELILNLFKTRSLEHPNRLHLEPIDGLALCLVSVNADGVEVPDVYCLSHTFS